MKMLLGLLVAAFTLGVASPAIGGELLVNGNFESGVPEENGSSFVCQGWRRVLWKPDLIKSWLADSKHGPTLAKDNKALKFLWDGSSICQYFSAEAGQPQCRTE